MYVDNDVLPDTSTPVIHHPRHGLGLGFTGAAVQSTRYAYPAFARAEDHFVALTAGCWVRCSDVTDDHQICGQWQSSLTEAVWKLYLDFIGAGDITGGMACNDAATTGQTSIVGVGNIYDTAEPHFIVGVWYLPTTDNKVHMELYLDGVLDSVAVASTTGWNTGGREEFSQFEVGASEGGDPEYINGDVYGLFVDRTRWGPDRIARAYQNTYDELFEPFQMPMLTPGNINITVPTGPLR